MLTRLPRVLIGIAGLASLAYLALRARTPPTLTRTLDLDSLGADLENWLPKLPYLPFIRIEIPGTLDYLQIAGDAETVHVDLPQTTARQRRLAQSFRRACTNAGHRAREARDSGDGLRLRCALPANPAVVAGVLTALLTDLYHIEPGTRLVAAVPGGG